MNPSKDRMPIAVWGLGHVGKITAAYFLSRPDCNVYGIDACSKRVAAIKTGQFESSNVELGIALSTAVVSGQLECIDRTVCRFLPRVTAHFLCVDTPTFEHGEQNLQSIKTACSDICSLSALDKGTLIVVRSTVLPGTTERIVVPYLELLSGKQEGVDFFSVVNPCFIRNVDYLEDLHSPERVVIGGQDLLHTARLAELYRCSSGKLFQTSCVEAELVKYVDNVFHALKVVFANEIADLAQELGVTGDVPLRILSGDRRLNISPAYLEPGQPYAGRCLPKDLLALDCLMRRLPINVPLLHAISLSNTLRTAVFECKEQSGSNPALQGTRQKAARP